MTGRSMRLLNHGLMYIIILKMPKCRTFKFILDSEHSGYVLISNSKFDLRFVTARVNAVLSTTNQIKHHIDKALL